MDSIFALDEADRAAFFRHMMQSFGATYICLWSYSPLPSNCLKILDGLYQEEAASSSSASIGRRLFDAYCGTLNYVDLGYVPGFAFKNNLPYIEMTLDYLQTIAHTEMQLQFYHGAGIKTIVFMGCVIGEIELGFSSAPQVNLEMGMRNWFPLDFSRQTYAENLQHLTNQTLIPTSSSSVSLESSIEIEGSCSPSCLFNNIQTQVLRLDPIHASTQIQSPTIGSIDQESSSCSQNMSAFGRAAAFTSYRADPFRIPTHKHITLFKRAVLFYRELERRRTHEVLVQGNMPTPTQIHHVIQERRRREKLNESF